MVSPSISPRSYEESDRQMVLDLGIHPATLATPQNRLIVIEEGAAKGAVVWTWPGVLGEEIPTLKEVVVSPVGRRDLYDDLLEAVCEAAQAKGHTRGQSRIVNEAVLDLMRQTFELDVTPEGRNVKTGKPGHWVIEFDLKTNRRILAKRREARLA